MLNELLFRMSRTLRKDLRHSDDLSGRGGDVPRYRRHNEPHSWQSLWDRLWQGTLDHRAFDLQTYENRLLYSAAPVVVPSPVVAEVVSVSPVEGITPDAPPVDATSLSESTLIVVDSSVPDYETLLEQLTQHQSGPTDILVLDSRRDGLEQIAERLEQLGQTRTIHILSHGDEAGLHLGNNWLSADTISQQAATLTQWQPFLTADADVLLYGCDLAANVMGQEFLRTFGQLTRADVAASTDATGAALLGGNWQLEFQFGTIDTPSLGESFRLFEWNGLLNTNTFQTGASYSGTQDTSLSASSPDTAEGATTTVRVGGAGATTGLIRFDDLFGNGPGQIPLGSTIHSASLQVSVTSGTSSESTISLHRVLASWSESSTWNTLGSGLSRNNVEVATVADALVSSTTAIGLQAITGLEESLQAWSDGAVNSGWALFGDNATEWAFTSSEGATAALRPMLIVDYTAPVAAGSQLAPTGEFRVNTATTNSQTTATNSRSSHDAVGIDANGNYVVVWTSTGQDGSGAGVYAQRYNSRGVVQGTEFRVNELTTNDQLGASVAMIADGGFIVTWTSIGQDGSDAGVYARIFDDLGNGSSEFRVNQTTTGTQQAPAIGVDGTGKFVIAWEGNGAGDSTGIYARRFRANGTTFGGEFLVNTSMANTQADAAIAVGQDGQFMIVWDDDIGTHGRRYNSTGVALDASDLLLHADYTSGNADVATNGTGAYHIVWKTTDSGDGSGRALWKMELGATDTTPQPPEQVTTSTINSQTEPSITSDGNGDFLITWQGAGPGDTEGVFARKYDFEGTPLGSEFMLNATTAGSQVFVSAAMIDPENFVAVWSGNGSGDNAGVYARTYGTLETGDSLLFTTWGNETSSGVSGLDSWTYQDILSLGDPNLTLGANASGSLSIAGSLLALGDGDVFPESLDVLQQDVLVGMGGNSVQLYSGDVLLSVWGNETLGSLSVQTDDVVVFRPDVVGSYASGTFFVLFDGMESVDGGPIDSLADIDLIEQTTLIGDVLLQPGDLVVADIGNPASALWVFHPTGVGTGTTTGSVTTLLIDSEINLDQEIVGVQVIERNVVIGGVQLREGNLLVTVNLDSTLGTNSLAVMKHDVALLDVTTTSANGPASVTASMLLTGSDVALDSGAEAIRTLALQSVPGSPPIALNETYTLTEDQIFDSASLWYDTNWSSRISLTFDNSARAENLTDFPVLVTLDANRIDYALAQANGQDLRFVDPNGQVLSYEIETWNPDGVSTIWVKVPRIDANSATDSMWLYYGNATAPAGQNPTDVWSNGYVGVWHLNGDPSGTQTVQDSSASNKDGTSIGMDATNLINGPIGSALNFNGTNEAIRIDSTASDPTAVNPAQLTIEAWANSTGDSGFAERIVNRRNIVLFPYESYGLATSASDNTQAVNSTGTPDLMGTNGSLPEDQWRYLTGTLSGSTSNLYIDGVLNATQSGVTSLGSSEDDITIGAGEMGYTSTLSQYWTGGIDEVRLSNVARSADWTAAQYASMTDTMITYGERQTVSGLLDNDHTVTSGGLTISLVDLSDLGGVATAVVLNDGQFTFTPGTSLQALAAGQTSTKLIEYTVEDELGNTAQATASIIVQGVNDAPVINLGVGPLTLTSVLEDSTNPPGDTVAAIIASAGGTLISDVDSGAIQGIAVTGVDSTNGTWEFSINGTTWSSLTGVSDTQASLLSTTSHVRFVPTAGYSGVGGALTFRAWDQASGTNGQSGVNVSVNGDATAFSTQATTASISITPINTAPVIVTNAGLTVLEGNAALLSSTKLAASDAENTPAQLVYTVIAVPAHGRLERVSAPGTAITTFTQADINANAVRYVHNGGETTSDSFSFSLTDGALTVTGSFAITVTAVNDAPTITVNSGLSVTEGGNGTLTTTKLSASDPDNTAVQLVYTVSTAPTHGRLERVAAPGVAITAFTQADLNDNSIRYVHDGGETTSDGFGFSLSDGVATVTGSFAITVTPVNDPPVVSVNTGASLSEGASLVISSTKLSTTDPDNTTAQRVFTVTGSPSNGRLEKSTNAGVAITSFTQADINNGIVRYVHDASETTSDGFSFSLSDGAATITGSFAITVTPINDPPVVSTQPGLTVLEGGTIVIPSSKLSTTDADNGAASLTYTVTGGLGFGHLALASTPGASITSFTQAQINANQIVYVQSGAESTAEYFTFSVSDGALSATGTLSLTITPQNDPPDFAAYRMTISEGQTLPLTTYNLLTNDDDTPATSLIYTVNSVTQGRFEFAASPGAAITSFTQDDINNTRVRFVHNGGEAAPSASLSVTDGVVSVGPSAMLMTFSNVNDPPTISTNAGVTLNEGATQAINSSKLAASDPDTEVAQRVFTVASGSLNGRLEKSTNAGVAITSFTQADINAGIIRYVHNGGETTSDSFAFSLSDGTASVTGTFAITITPINDAPVLTTNSLTVSEGQTVSLTTTHFNASDPDSATLTFTVTSLTHGEFRNTGTGLAVTSFTKSELQAGIIEFVHDGGNAAPTVLISVSDGSITTAPVAIGFVFNPVNDLPVLADNHELLLNEGASQLIGSSLLRTTDGDNTPLQLSYTVTGSPVHGRLERVSAPGVSVTSFTQADIDAGAIRYVHDSGESIVDAFNFTVTDGIASLSNTFAITVTPVNDPPGLTASTIAISEGQSVILSTADLDATDADSGSLLFTVSGVTHAVFRDITSGNATSSFTGAQVQSGQIRFLHDGSEFTPTATVSVSDGVTSTSPVAISFVFSNANDPPVLAPATFSVSENAPNGSLVGQVVWNDPDAGDDHTFRIQSGPSSSLFSIDAFTGEISVADGSGLNFEVATSHELLVEITDSTGASSQATIQVAVQNVNEVPVSLGFPPVLSTEDGPVLTLDLTTGFSDPESALLSFQIVSMTNPGLFSSAQINASGVLELRGAANANGASSVIVRATDPLGLSATTSISVVLASVNDVPIANPDLWTTPIDSVIVFSPSTLLANDADADHDSLSVSITRPPIHGTLTANIDGTFTYNPGVGYSGIDSFEYTASDGTTSSAAATVSLTSSAVGPGPTGNTGTSDSGSSNSSDGSGDSLNISDPANGTTSASTTATASGSEDDSSTEGSYAGTHTHNDDTELLSIMPKSQDEDGLGLFLTRMHSNVDEDTSRVRSHQTLDATLRRSGSRHVAGGLPASDDANGLSNQFVIPAADRLHQLRATLASSANQSAFAEVSKSLQSNHTQDLIFEVPALAGASLTVGYVVWMLRGGLLISSLLAQMPMWSIVDPLTVLDSLDQSDEDDESIGSLVEQGQSELEPV